MTKSYSRKKSRRKSRRSGRALPLKKSESKVWRWWKGKKKRKSKEGVKWTSLQHNGPFFAPEYKRVPRRVKFYYNGAPMTLSKEAEEVAGFYGKMLKENYTKKKTFNNNFFDDWREVMNPREKKKITNFNKCDFEDFYDFYNDESEKRKKKSAEEKKNAGIDRQDTESPGERVKQHSVSSSTNCYSEIAPKRIKKENEAIIDYYGHCTVDGHKQKVTNFRLEPPGLFRGRGNHPKMGKLKRRVEAEDIVINIGKGKQAPRPPKGHRWKDIIHDNSVTWLASWKENISDKLKYIMLNPSSQLKGESDILKYETARRLKNHVRRIRKNYMKDLQSRDLKVRQRAVAMYFIDKLALRTGNEKGKETADTVGCCSLRVEHIRLDPNGVVVHFDFPGKDTIRFKNSVEVDGRVFDNIEEFMEGKKRRTHLFDCLKPSVLNNYLNEAMEGLTAKVFRTYHASIELEKHLKKLTKKSMSLEEKLVAYNTSNRRAAILCNHHRAVPKSFAKSMKNIKKKIKKKKDQLEDLKKDAKRTKKRSDSERLKKKTALLKKQIEKLQTQATLKEDNKDIALTTSKLNYLDPRISVAWCKKWDVPIEKIFNKTQRERFRWAIETTNTRFKF